MSDQTPRRPNGDLSAMLARIDERTMQLVTAVNEIKRDAVTRTELDTKLQPIRLIAFGLVGTILLGVIGALLAGVLR